MFGQFHKGSNVAKKTEAWIQKEMRDSQYNDCTVAYKENNVYNIHMQPKGNEIDAVESSENWENLEDPGGANGADPGGAGGARSNVR